MDKRDILRDRRIRRDRLLSPFESVRESSVKTRKNAGVGADFVQKRDTALGKESLVFRFGERATVADHAGQYLFEREMRQDTSNSE